MRKVISLILMLTVSVVFAGTYSGGDGSSGNPYQINNLNDLQELSTSSGDWDSFFIQTADIDAGATSGWNADSGFSPIGVDYQNRFTGEYNGQGHTIDSLYIDRPSGRNIGLFGYTWGSEIDSVGVTNVDITGLYWVGGLVGYNRNSSTVSNSYSTGSVSGSGSVRVGGLVGANSHSTVSNSFSTGSVSGDEGIGGLVGSNEFSTVSNSYSTGSVSGDDNVGGLVGVNYSSTVSNSYSTGSVSSNDNVGGLVGYNYHSSTVSNSYSTGSVSGSTSVGGLVGNTEESTSTVSNSFWDKQTSGQSSSDGGTGKTTAEMTDLYTSNCFYQNGWDFVEETTNGTDDYWNQGNDRNDDYPYLAWQYSSDSLGITYNYSGGLGTESDPYEIATLEDLDSLQNRTEDWDSCFIQTADIDAGATSDWDSDKGFSPIGNSSTKFTGEYNGQGHTIDSLFIDRPTTLYIGLFGYTDGSEIDSIGMTNVDITGDYNVGGLVGYNSSSTVSNSYSTGSVSAGRGYVGGLVGKNYSSSTVSNSYSTGSASAGRGYVGGLVGDSDNSTVSNSYSTGSVSGSDEYVGGLVGRNNNSSTVSNSYSTGSVSGSNYFVGGLVGENNSSTVSNSYSTGSVSGGKRVGGLVGYNNSSSTVSNSYSTGSVSGDGELGGLVGVSSSSTATNSFWDTNTSGLSSSAGGTGKTTVEMTDLYFTTNCFYQNGWDYIELTTNGTDDIWNQGNSRNSNYPYLDWQYPNDDLGLTGFNYSGGLGTESDPYQIATLEDLDSLQVKTEDWASCFVQVADINASATETWDAGSGFSSIGNDGTKFTGKYNGRGHTIDSLFIDRPTTLYIGLFGYTDGAEIDSVGLRNLDITGDYYVGGLVGWNDSSSTVSNSYSTGSVSGNASIVGGLVGYNISSTVSNSYSTGSVSGSGEYVGGLVGYNVTSSTVSNSYSTGSVSGGTYVGGLVGYNNFSSQISNSYSTGSVSGGTSRVGGLVGPNMNSSTISNCYSTGSVSAGGFGLVGYNNNSTVSNSFWDTETSGQDTSAGGTGKTTAEMQDLYFTTNCFYQSGWDFVDTTANGTDDYWNQGNAKNDDYPYLDWQYPSDSLGLLENNTIDINVKIYLEGAYK